MRKPSHIALVLSILIIAAFAVVPAPSAQAQSFSVLHNFTGGLDGSQPVAGLTMDRAENLYGAASAGGRGYGTVFKLAHRGSGWTLTPLYGFSGGE